MVYWVISMPSAERIPLSHPEKQPSSSRRPTQRIEGYNYPEPDAFDNPEFNAAVDEAVARVPASKIERPKETDEEITARISEELRTGVRAEKREAQLRAKEERQRAENERRMHENDRKEAVTLEHHVSEPDPQQVELEKMRARFRETPRVKVQRAIKEEPAPAESEADRLRKQISKKNDEEGKVIAKMNEIRKNRGVLGLVRSGIAKLTGGYVKTQEDQWLETYEHNLAEIDAERDALMEDLQQLSRRPGTQATSARVRKEMEPVETSSFMKTKKQAAKGMARDIAATFVPGVKTEFEKDQEALKDGQGIEVPAEEQTDLKAFEERLEEAWEKPAEESAAPAVERKVDTSSLRLPPEVERMERQRMTRDRAAAVLSKPVAYDLWALLGGENGNGGKLKEHPELRLAISRSNLTSTEHPATLYVFEVAKAVQAKNMGNEETFEAAAAKLDAWNKLLGINNAYVNSVLATRVGSRDVLRGTKFRTGRVQKMNVRNKF